jgi:hypothetical protein
VLVVVVIGLGVFQGNVTDDDIRTACTEEAKICPDGSAVARTGPRCEFAACPTGGAKPEGIISETEARSIAEKTCIKGGESLAPGYYNENSKTWWFDANLNATRPGCNPACVVSAETKTAEINWRCTGLIAPKGSADDIQAAFAKKYPQSAKTVAVSVNQESGNYARGSVSFGAGEGGGNFLAMKKGGEWQIVFDGNGQIPCSLATLGFPSGMLTDCAQ